MVSGEHSNEFSKDQYRDPFFHSPLNSNEFWRGLVLLLGMAHKT